ncbi:MAG: hypothetical protein IPO93_13165 [Actinobacteria bacterium]|nr:hypothetical protein [Actinomycetota bacterium]
MTTRTRAIGMAACSMFGVVLILPACDASGGSVATQTSAATTSQPSSDPGRSDAIMASFIRSGGIAGTTDTVKVSYGGRVVVDKDGRGTVEYQLSDDELLDLRQSLEDAEMGSLDETYQDDGVADAYTYWVAFDGHHIEATQTVLPASMEPAVDDLESLISRAS